MNMRQGVSTVLIGTCTVWWLTAGETRPASADEIEFEVNGRVIAQADGERIRERISGDLTLDTDDDDFDLEGDLDGRRHDVELDLDADRRGSSNRYRLSGDVDVDARRGGGDTINEDFERTRGQLRVRTNRQGDSILRLSTVSRERGDNGVARVKLRGESNESLPTNSDDDSDRVGSGTGAPSVVLDRLAELHPGGEVINSGRDADDGYWWFEVRVGGVVYDVEISDTGEVLENDIDDD